MKKEKKIDNYQKAAIAANKNSVVSAGAGSGKTTVLSERFTDLVLNRNCKVDEILTLTFTKKATVEMSSRIYQVLKEKAPEQAKDFYKTNIKTLDSYCNSVAKMGAHLFGVTPDFTQDDETIKSQVMQIALPFILQHRDNVSIKALVNTKEYAQIAQELFVDTIMNNSTVAEPIDFDSSILAQQNEIIQAWKKETAKALDVYNQLEGAFNDFSGNKKSASIIKIGTLLQNDIPEQPNLSVQQIENSDSTEMENFVLAINSISSCSLVGLNHVSYAEIKEAIKVLRTVTEVLISIVNYVSAFYITKNLLPLLKEFQQMVNDLKRTSGVLTFKDVSNLATCILRDYPEIRQIEKEKYKAIMIDEFQDNNSMQRDMLFMLSEKLDCHQKGIPSVENLCPDKLFFVGDEKQSIYRFRGADVAVFRSLSDDFKEGNLSMSINYRSHPSLINSFNLIFGGKKAVFYTEEAEKEAKKSNVELPKYEAVYHNVDFQPDDQIKVIENPKLLEEQHIHLARYDNSQEAAPNQLIEEEAEAQWVAEKIKEITEHGVNDKTYSYGDIAILLRSYNLQPLYERTLLRQGIPYNTETVTGFFADGPVNDIFSFLRICIYEQDTISYAQVLRSPFVNLSIEETNALILFEPKPFLTDGKDLLNGDSLRRYDHAKSFFEELKECVKYESLTKIITKLWYETGYRYETLWNNKVSMYNKMYDLIFELARQSEQKNLSLSAFVDSVRPYMDDGHKLENMDIPLEKTNGVHILTIHKSKGLEYDVVFICGTHKGTGNDSNSTPVYSSRDYGITINPPANICFLGKKTNYFYQKVNTLNIQMQNAELRRLTYVALTRASKELYITNGKYSQKPDADIRYCPGAENKLETIYQTLEPVFNYYESDDCNENRFFNAETIPPYNIDFDDSSVTSRKNNLSERNRFVMELAASNAYEKSTLISKETVEQIYALPSQLHSADDENTCSIQNYSAVKGTPYPEINDIVIASIPKKDGKPQEGAEPRFGFNNFGTIAHAFMESVITGEPPAYSNRDIVGLEKIERDEKKLKEICEDMQNKFKASDLGKLAINSKWHKAEYAFRSRVGSKIIKGIIDLVFQNDDGTYSIVDYKTNQKIEPELYYSQLACYRQAIAQMLGVDNAQNIKCYLYYLRFGQSVDISAKCDSINVQEELLKNINNNQK